MREPVPLPLGVVVRGMRTLIVLASTPSGPPLLEVLPYEPHANPATVGAGIASRLNWHPRLVRALRDMVKADAFNATNLNAAQRLALRNANNLLKLMDGQ